jgi:hypothetical protein
MGAGRHWFTPRGLSREPLFHFLLLGGLLFAAHAVFNRDEKTGAAPPAVRITAADTDWLRQMWARQWQRPPTDEELARLVADHVREEVLAREAKALELDIGDTVVRRRLAQKMSFLLDDTIRFAEPPEQELLALYEARPELVSAPGQISFTQVFFQREQSDGRISATLAALSDGSTEVRESGDRLLIGDSLTKQDERGLSGLFGAAFAKAVFSQPVGSWSGPLESAYGLHLVKVTEVSPALRRPFAESRERLAAEWRRERQEAASGRLLKELMRKYRIVADPALRPWLEFLGDQVEVRP